MPTTYAQLRDAVAAYMHRPADVFYVNGQDMLLRAVNNAKNFAQRELDLERSRVFAQLDSVNLTNGANLVNAVEFGTTNNVDIKTIRQAFLSDGQGGQIPIDILGRDSYVNRLKRRYEEAATVLEARAIQTVAGSFPLGLVQYGTIVYLVPANSSVLGSSAPSVYFDAVKWLPDFSPLLLAGTATSTVTNALVDTTKNFTQLGVRIGDIVNNVPNGTSAFVTSVVSSTQLSLSANIMTSGQAYSLAVIEPSQTNFMLEYCFDYMMFRTIYELNFFLKEDQRVPLSKDLLNGVWGNVKRWNETVVANSVTEPNE